MRERWPWPPNASTPAVTVSNSGTTVARTRFNSPTLRPLRSRDFRVIWLGSFVSNVGTWMEATALTTLVARETRSATQVAFAAIAGFLPSAFASPIGGALADRFDRRRFLQVTLLLETFFAGLLALVVSLGERRTAPLAAIVFMAATVNSAALPNRQAMFPSLVEPEDLPAAIALGSATWNGGRVFGPMLAVLAETIGPAWAFSINALSFLVLFGAWMTVTLPSLIKPDGPRLGLVALLREGLGHIRRTPDLRFAIGFIAVLAGTAGPFIGLLAIMARVRFGIGAALFVTAQGFGAVCGALSTTRLSRRFGRRGTMLRAWFVLPVGLLLYAFAPHRLVAAAAVVLLGGAYMVLFAGAQSTLQLGSPPEVRARVLAVFSVSLSAAYCAALLISGRVADARNIQVATVMQAALTLVGILVLAKAFPRWWHDAVPATIRQDR